MTNNDYPSDIHPLLRDLERVLACVEYNCDYKDIMAKYGFKDLKQFIEFVFINLLRRYCHIC